MNPGRNDPCHCGSGKKYKLCCARVDAAAAPAVRLAGHATERELRDSALGAIRRPVAWEADIAPMPMQIATEPSARPAAILVAAEGLVLSVDLATHPPSEAAGAAASLRDAIAKLLASGGTAPSRLTVRHDAVAEQLRPLLRDLGVAVVEANRTLPMIDEMAAMLRRQTSGVDADIPAVSNPDTWAAWDLPADDVRDVLAAAAEFYRVAPWEMFASDGLLELRMANGSRWYASTLGGAGETYGLGLYENSDEFFALVSSAGPSEAFIAHRHIVLSLTFDARADLPKAMRREFAKSAWPVAGPSAYPSMWALNTIGGGLSVEQARDMTTALGVLARLALAFDVSHTEGASPAPTPWLDVTGCSVHPVFGMELEPLWDVPRNLTSAFAAGSAADPSAMTRDEERAAWLKEKDDEMIRRFREHKVAVDVGARRVNTDSMNVDLFANVIHGELGVYLPGLSEPNLRLFLYDLLPRKMIGSKSVANGIRTSLRRFFEYLENHEDLRYPWARAILRDKLAFEERWDTFPGGSFIDPPVAEWISELTDDLVVRAFVPGTALAGADQWSEMMGMEEATLYDELQRLWLHWREEEIQLGNDRPLALVKRLMERQAEWETTPQFRLKGRSPSQVIIAERKRNARR